MEKSITCQFALVLRTFSFLMSNCISVLRSFNMLSMIKYPFKHKNERITRGQVGTLLILYSCAILISIMILKLQPGDLNSVCLPFRSLNNEIYLVDCIVILFFIVFPLGLNIIQLTAMWRCVNAMKETREKAGMSLKIRHVANFVAPSVVNLCFSLIQIICTLVLLFRAVHPWTYTFGMLHGFFD